MGCSQSSLSPAQPPSQERASLSELLARANVVAWPYFPHRWERGALPGRVLGTRILMGEVLPRVVESLPLWRRVLFPLAGQGTRQ